MGVPLARPYMARARRARTLGNSKPAREAAAAAARAPVPGKCNTLCWEEVPAEAWEVPHVGWVPAQPPQPEGISNKACV